MSETRSLSAIASEIYSEWGEKVSVHARPYLEAMEELESITDRYMYEDGKSIVRYFLANASTFRGEAARRIKAELKAML